MRAYVSLPIQKWSSEDIQQQKQTVVAALEHTLEYFTAKSCIDGHSLKHLLTKHERAKESHSGFLEMACSAVEVMRKY